MKSEELFTLPRKISDYCQWLKDKQLDRAYVFRPAPGLLMKTHNDVIDVLKAELERISHKAEIIMIDLSDYEL